MSTLCYVDTGLLGVRPVPRFERAVLSEGQEVFGVGYHQGLWRTHDNGVALPDLCAPGILRVQMDVFSASMDEYRLSRSLMPDVGQVPT